MPRYDFNWQLDYDLTEPMVLAPGTKLRVSFIYDNSEHNHSNPDPKQNVTWGEQTYNEMMYFRVNYRWSAETSTNVRNDLQSKLMESRAIGQLDDNADGKLTMAELQGSSGASLRNRFAALDSNKDGALTLAEMNAGNATAAQVRRQEEADSEL